MDEEQVVFRDEEAEEGEEAEEEDWSGWTLPAPALNDEECFKDVHEGEEPEHGAVAELQNDQPVEPFEFVQVSDHEQEPKPQRSSSASRTSTSSKR